MGRLLGISKFYISGAFSIAMHRQSHASQFTTNSRAKISNEQRVL